MFLLRRCESAKLKFAAIALSDVDRLRLCNFPHQVAQHFRSVIAKGYLPGISSEGARDGSCYEIDLNGMPWTQNSSFNLQARAMLTSLMKEAAKYGWQLAASADVSAKYVHTENGPDYPVDVHTWFMCFTGVPKGVMVPESNSAPVSYSQLRVSDLEAGGNVGPPPSYEEARFS